MTDLDLAWLAGLLEGEGSFQRGVPSKPTQPRVMLNMTDEDVVTRAARVMGVVSVVRVRVQPGRKPVFQIALRGARAVALMQLLRPLMGQRRQRQIDEAVACYRALPRGGYRPRRSSSP